MASLLFLLLFGGILSSFQAILASSDSTSTCGNQVTLAKKLSKPDDPCGHDNLYQGYCVKKCPVGYYPNSGKCLSCDTICSSCNKTRCLSCEDSNYLSKHGLCVKSCDAKLKTLMKNSSSPRVRLVEGRSSLEGVVEVYYDGSWGTICADGWNDNTGKVLCKELRLGDVVEAKIVGQGRFKRLDGYKDMKIWLSGVDCKGKENSILECKHKDWGDNQCSHLEDVGIRCSGPDATNTCETSCSDGYFASNGKCLECPLDCKTCTSLDKCSSCNEMRFLEGTFCVPKCKPGSYGNLETRKCKPCSDICETCQGTAHGPVQCTSCPPNKQTNFLNGDKCVAKCPGRDVASSKYIRLSGNHSSPYMGLLEVKYKGAWHTVCDDGFDLDTARVFCRELGYGQPIKYRGRAYGQGTGKILTQDVDCKGDEISFIECRQQDWFSPGCSHYEDVGLWCKPPTDGYVVQDRCVGKCPLGTFPNKKRVCELCDRKCLTCSEHPENCLSCREPYFYNGTTCAATCPDGTFANATLRACLLCNRECMTCNEQADKCLSCKRPLVHNGTHCSMTCPDKIYRKEYSCVQDCGLRHYPKDKVCHVCPLKCLVCPSNTKCKACEHGFVLTKQGKCERRCPTGQYWTSLEPKSVGINLPLRLSSVEGFKYKGRLEIKHGGVWGSICDDGWSGKNAEVACKQLMLGPPVKVVYLRYKSIKELRELNISQIWLDDVDCKGTEDSLADCKSRGWGDMNCVHSEDVHIECAYPGISSCETECPPAYYKNGTSCMSCSVNCLNCSGTANNCSSCKEGYFRTNDSICVKECPPGFYKTDDRHCKPCHPDCWTCSGPALPQNPQCTSCKQPNVLVGVMCLKSCSKGLYERGVNPYIELWKKVGPYEGVVLVSVKGRKGFVCNRYLRIEDGHVVCKELQMGKALQVYAGEMYSYYTTPLLIKNQRCIGNESSIFNCPPRQYAFYCSRRNIMSVKCSGPDLSSRCLKKTECPTEKNFYITEDNKVCDFCSKNCLGCEKNATRCTACSEGFLLTWDNKCVQYCREGTFYDSQTNRCKKCDTNKCVACADNKGLCTVCPAGKYLTFNTCLDTCTGVGYSRHGSDQLRLVPDRSRLIVQGNSSRGLVEMFVDGKNWLPVCGINWDIQAGAVACHELGYGDPIRVFPEHKYTLGFTIERIPKLNCTGKEKQLKDCTIIGSCPFYRIGGVVCTRSTPKKVCDTLCTPGFYQDKTECRACSSDCTSCVGTASTCTSCNNTYVLHGSKCLEKCPDGYFIHLEVGNMTCMRCSDTCKTCHDGRTNDHCSSCDKPYFLRGSSCVETCYPDHNLEDLMSGEKPSENVRLVNGSNDQEGFVQVRKKSENNNKWAILCNTNKFIISLVCQELGFQSGRFVRLKRSDDFFGVPKLQVSCNGYEKSLKDCNLYTPYYCPQPVIACSNKPLDKRICREENKVPCARGVCFTTVTCADGDGKVIPKGHSYCRYCPVNYYGDGVNCQAISKVPPSVQRTYFERQLSLRSTYYFPCLGRSGRSYIYPNRNNWFKDEKRLELSSGRFFLGPLQYEDAGIYKCVLENSVGSVTVTFNITIIGPPMITRADNIDIVHGDSVKLNCEVLAQPPATISWHFGNITFSKNSTRHGGPKVSNGSLYIPQPIAKDAGTYTCVAENLMGMESEEIKLRIGEEPRFEKKANSLTVAKGEKAAFSCRPLSTGRTMSIKWRRNGQTLKTGGKYEVGDESLTIKDVSSEDCGEYYCVARDGHSIITSVGTLAIKNEDPCIHTRPQNLDLGVGMYARFYCAASGDPAPEILWQKKKQPDPNVFEIKKVNISHVGVYTCTARSKDKVSNAYAFLSVDDHNPCPFIFKKPKNTPGTFGQSATFYCDGVTLSVHHITWYKGNSIITDSKKYKLMDDNKKLVINNVDEDDIGEYKCVISDIYGDASATASLTSLNVGSQRGSSSSPNTAGIVIGVLVCILVILIILYFVHRYHRHGATPADVIKDVKRKTFSRFQSPTHHTVLKYDTSEYDEYRDDEVYDTSDTNPFVRD